MVLLVVYMHSMVVTNLRVDKNLWLQIKSMAASSGMSVNQYLINLIQSVSVKNELALDRENGFKTKRKVRYSIWNLPKLAKIKDKPMGLSDLDKAIYEE